MPKLLRSVLWVFLAVPIIAFVNPPEPFFKAVDGVMFYPNEDLSGNKCAIQLQLLKEKIPNLIAVPKKEFPKLNSLITVYQSNTLTKLNIEV